MSGVLPRTERDAASAEFFDAAARGQLLVKRGASSGTVLAPEARTDPGTGTTDLESFVASGKATLVSWVVVHRAPLPILARCVPYVSAVVELIEGPWLIVRLLVDDAAGLHVGQPLWAQFVRSGEDDGETVPVFAPA